MSTSTPSATGPAHRSLSNIRSGAAALSQTGPSSPRTPARGIASAFGSPSSLRVEEETVVIELGTRFIRAGFAGDHAPKAVVCSGPEDQRRAGDFRSWVAQAGDRDYPKGQPSRAEWAREYEIWASDLRDSDVSLVQDKIDRALREAFNNHLLIDSRPRRMSLVLPSMIPLPLISATLDTLFNPFQALTVSLVSASVMSAVAAGVRSAIVVDLGWSETVVTSVYEYREIRHTRSVRGGKMLVNEVHDLLADLQNGQEGGQAQERDPEAYQSAKPFLSFEECEDITCRMVWCGQASKMQTAGDADRLSTVEEHEESPDEPSDPQDDATRFVRIPLESCHPPGIVEVPFQRLSEPCENTFMAAQYDRTSFDDNELPIPQLIYQHLLVLPIDARAACMSRILFTGGCSNIPGLRQRLFDELCLMVRNQGWDPVRGKGADQVRRQVPRVPAAGGFDNVRREAASPDAGRDPIEQLLEKTRNELADMGMQGRLRAVHTLGAWSGASMVGQLRAMAVATIDRDSWLQQGIHGASRPGEVDLKAQQRQSLNHGSMLHRASSSSATWTLGAWGVV
ncbi:hypothetical protein ACRALDRAFT_1091501 [Sodiomyces alcalophilus JCM 7366]|uniref:uncharacterized protein n=1 Tax=Sodiomyces alcalophilus JCM 7366 TaxID=591952 RepID=UPI0039B442E4